MKLTKHGPWHGFVASSKQECTKHRACDKKTTDIKFKSEKMTIHCAEREKGNSNTRQRLENDATWGNSLKQMQGQDLSEKSARYKKNNASMIKPFKGPSATCPFAEVKTSRFRNAFFMAKCSISCSDYLSNTHFVRDFLKEEAWISSTLLSATAESLGEVFQLNFDKDVM